VDGDVHHDPDRAVGGRRLIGIGSVDPGAGRVLRLPSRRAGQPLSPLRGGSSFLPLDQNLSELGNLPTGGHQVTSRKPVGGSGRGLLLLPRLTAMAVCQKRTRLALQAVALSRMVGWITCKANFRWISVDAVFDKVSNAHAKSLKIITGILRRRESQHACDTRKRNP